MSVGRLAGLCGLASEARPWPLPSIIHSTSRVIVLVDILFLTTPYAALAVPSIIVRLALQQIHILPSHLFENSAILPCCLIG